MINIMLPDEIARQIEEVAKIENRPVEEVVASMVQQYTPQETEPKKAPNWDLIIGIGDKNVTDMSTTVRETLDAYYKKKYANPD
jgi:hypothetical protein